MIEFSQSARKAISIVRDRIGGCDDVAILTGFIGQGESDFLKQLSSARTRVVFGLTSERPFLPPAQFTELKRLRKIGEIRTYPGLHAKLYLFNRRVVVIGSANLSRAGFETLQETLLISDDPRIVRDSEEFFERIWLESDRKAVRIQPLATIEPVGETAIVATLGRRPDPEYGAFHGNKRPYRHISHGTHRNNNGASPVSVRVCAYAASWLEKDDSFETSRNLIWTTGERAQPGDLQLFCVSKNLSGVAHLSNDPRVDAVHSLWRMTGPVKEYPGDKWKFQAPFQLVFRLKRPVGYHEMVRARLVSKYSWPMGSRGKVLVEPAEIFRLADVLEKANPSMRTQIRKSLNFE